MPYASTIQSINDALRLDAPNAPISTRALTRIEIELVELGEFPGVVGEMVRKFREALSVLKIMRESAPNVNSILLASAHVHEVWSTLAPTLEQLAAGMPWKSTDNKAPQARRE